MMRTDTPLRAHGGRFVLFGLVGVFNTGVDFAVYSAIVLLGGGAAIANICAFAVANPFSYAFNSRVTFRRDGRAAPASFVGYAKYLAAHLASLVISTGIVLWLAPQHGPFAAKLAAVVVTLFINYFACAFLVFPRSAPSQGNGPNPSAKEARSASESL